MGHLTRDPEMRFLDSGTGICKFSIAHNRKFKKEGDTVEETSFFDMVPQPSAD